MSSLARVLRNTGFLAASNLVTKVLGALFVILLARHLGDSFFGQYTFAFSFVAVFVIFCDLGLDALTIRNVARRKEQAGQYLEVVGILRLGLGLIMVALALVVGYLMELDSYLIWVILVAGVTYIFDKISGLFYALFRAHERMGLEAGTQILWKLAQVSLGLGAIFYGFSLLDIVLVLLVASVVRCMAGFTLVLGMGIRPQREGMRSRAVARGALPFAAYEVGNALYMNMVVIVLFLLHAPEQTGWFTAALRVLMFLLLIPSAFDAAIYPLFSRLYERSQSDMKLAFGKSMKFSLAIALPVAMLMVIYSEQLAALFGAGFETSAQILELIAFVLPLFTLNMIMKTALWSADAQNRMALNIWLASLVLLVVGYLLIAERSFTGAGLALIVGETSLLVLNLAAVSKKRLSVERHLWKPVAAAGGMVGIYLVLSTLYAERMGLINISVFAIVVYSLLLLATGAFTKLDRELLRSALGSSRKRL